MNSITESLLDWRVNFREEWVTLGKNSSSPISILNKGNLTSFRDRNLIGYLIMQRKCGDWYPKCNNYIFANTPGDLSQKGIKILNEYKETAPGIHSIFINSILHRESTDMINNGLKKCVENGVSPREIAQNYLKTLESCSLQEGFGIEEDLKKKIQSVIDAPEKSWVSLKIIAIAVVVIGAIALARVIAARRFSEERSPKAKEPLDVLSGVNRFKSLTSPLYIGSSL